MKKLLYISVFFVAAGSFVYPENLSMGTITVDNVTTELKSAVAVFQTKQESPDLSIHHLTFYLFPFQPGSSQIKDLQKDDIFWLLDPKDRKAYTILELTWLEKESVGNMSEANVNISHNAGDGISGFNWSTNESKDFNFALDGIVQAGLEITLSSRWLVPESNSMLEKGTGWNLKLKTKILSAEK